MGQMSTHSASKPRISNDDGIRKVANNNSVEQETEVVGKSENIVSSTPDSTSDNFDASEMGNAIDKGPPVLKKIIKPDSKTVPVAGKPSSDAKQATPSVTDTCQTPGETTSGISNDDEKTKVDSSSVEHETEVAGLSTKDNETPLPSSDSIASGNIVDAVSSTSDSVSDNLADSDMCIAVDKSKRTTKPVPTAEIPSNSVKQATVLGTETDHILEHVSDSQPAPSSSSAANLSDVILTDVNNKTAEDDNPASDVILRGVPGAHNDVTTSGITAEVDSRSELFSSPLTASVDGVCTTTSSTDLEESLDVLVGNPGIPDAHNDVTTSGITAEVDSRPELFSSPLTASVDGVCTTSSSTDLMESLDVRPGNPGIPDTHNDVTTSGITPDADTLLTSPLTVSVDKVCTTTSSTDLMESLDIGLDNVEEVLVSTTENSRRHSGRSPENYRDTEVTCNSDGHAVKFDDICSQEDADLDPCLSSQNNDVVASFDDR